MPILCPDCNKEMRVRKVLGTRTALADCPYCKKGFKVLNEKQLFPSNINSFSWGAFTIFPIWGFWNGMPWLFFIHVIFYFIPVVGIIMDILVGFYLGFKGNKLSWEKKNWSSISNFEYYQKQWGKAGIVSGVVVFVISFLAYRYEYEI